jgi:phosphoadenosine phosphosulfate reductase
MVKKRLVSGDPCEKCAQTEDMLRRRDVWDRIDEVVWAIEGDDASPGVELGRRHGVAVAPFFIVRFEDGSESVYTSGMRLFRDHLSQMTPSVAVVSEETGTKQRAASAGVDQLTSEWKNLEPPEIVGRALEHYRERCAVVLGGAEDVVLVDMAVRSGAPFQVLFVDTGRHHAATYALIDTLARHYGIEIRSLLPDSAELMRLLESKGQNSFLRDGHAECCGVRRRAPLARALRDFDAWIGHEGLGRELDRSEVAAVVEADTEHGGDRSLARVNPLVAWDNNAIWSYVRKHDVPHNELQDQGYRFIACEPCTRAIRPDQQDAEGIWWWEAPGRQASSAPGEGEGI